MVLFSLLNFPGPWWYLVPGALEATPMFVVYLGIVLGIVGNYRWLKGSTLPDGHAR